MREPVFAAFSLIYLTSLAVVDGIFNRLVFREKRKLPYSSLEKKEIYQLWEWRAVGLILLLLLPIVLPSLTAYLLGGVSYLLIYLILLLLLPWDLIFGALVFDDILGDRPSIALPYLGWISLPLWLVMAIRLILALILIVWKISLKI